MAKIPLGTDAKFFIGTREVSTAQNLTLNLEKGEADVTTRGAGGWKETLATNKDASVDATMLWDPDDPSFAEIAMAFFKNEALDCKFLDGPIATGTGLAGFFAVFKFARDEQLDGALIVNVTFKPTYAGSDKSKKPRWLVRGVAISN
ncbi:MAG: phage tail tube protein [Thermoguttaceae bacterium]